VYINSIYQLLAGMHKKNGDNGDGEKLSGEQTDNEEEKSSTNEEQKQVSTFSDENVEEERGTIN